MEGVVNKFLRAACGIVALGFAFATPAHATNFSFTGNLPNANAEQGFNFTVGATSNVTFVTYSYAGGTNAASQSIAGGGFDPILALFNADTGALIGQNDDGGSNVPPGDTGANFDT